MIRICRDAEELIEAAAGLFVATAREATLARGGCAIALSGGRTPREIYRRLAAVPLRDRVDWSRLDLFWGDERCVPPDDERSNYRMARLALLDAVPAAAARANPIPCGDDPEAAARRYEETLRAHFGGGPCRFDLVMLGLGEDAHTASLFAESAADAEPGRWVAPVRIAGQDFARVTLTPRAINAARTILFLVMGEAKAAALQRTLEGARDPDRLPAQRIHPEEGRVLWLVDEDAAHLLAARAAHPGRQT
jgi:6-phosphogluconolactonase